MNLATAIVLLVVAALVVAAVLVLRKGKGTCDCGEMKPNDCSGCSADCPFRR